MEVAVLVFAGGFFLPFLLVAVIVLIMLAMLVAVLIPAVPAVLLSFPVGFVDDLEIFPIGTEAVTKRPRSQFKPSHMKGLKSGWRQRTGRCRASDSL
jgi:uncharacterized membrane protein YkvA (DUF1232 family)